MGREAKPRGDGEGPAGQRQPSSITASLGQGIASLLTALLGKRWWVIEICGQQQGVKEKPQASFTIKNKSFM